MLRKENIDHILRAAASVTNQSSFVLIGTGAVIATARHVPAFMMMTPEIDLYVEGDDNETLSALIDATIGHGSMFHRTFRYYGDGVGPRTAIMPQDWRSRAITYTTAKQNGSSPLSKCRRYRYSQDVRMAGKRCRLAS